ncbi:MAG: LCP family protein [Anaerolineae bacterium]
MIGGVFILYRLIPPPRTNILVLGLDARPGEPDVTRTDAMMLVTVDPRQPYTGMLSIPRDLYVNVPGYGYNRINTAHVFGESTGAGNGPVLAAQTVSNAFGISVHRTVRLNYDGFVAIIDAAGGIRVDVPTYIIDYEYPTNDYGTTVIEFQPGPQTMNGERALQYARTRHGSSDFDRAARQQQIVVAFVRKMANPLNWPRIPAVYSAVAQNVDTNLTVFDALALGPAVLMSGNIEQEVLDRTYVRGTMTSTGASVQEPNWVAINPLIDRMFRR